MHWLSGGVVDLGAQVGVPTPLNRAVRDILMLHAEGGADAAGGANACADRMAAGVTVGVSQSSTRPPATPQLEQLDRVGASDLAAVGLAHAALVEPVRRVAEVLERVVDREHDPVDADLRDRVEQRGRAEVARRGEVEIGAEIVRHPLARRVFVRRLHPVVAVVDAPQIVRQALAEMPENDLQPRVLVEQAAADQPQRMHAVSAAKPQVGPSSQGCPS